MKILGLAIALLFSSVSVRAKGQGSLRKAACEGCSKTESSGFYDEDGLNCLNKWGQCMSCYNSKNLKDELCGGTAVTDGGGGCDATGSSGCLDLWAV